MTLTIIFTILLTHWVADFVLQTDWQAKNKSTNNKALLYHTFIYTICWYPFALINFNYTPLFSWFIIITFVSHTITDYFTSRLNTKLYKEGKIHEFFVSIGFDQVLHYIQLFTTYYLLKQV